MKTKKAYSASDSMPLLSGAMIYHLFEMASQYGFLILKPYYRGSKPDIQIEIPTAEQRRCIESVR
jgi:hypothetical protein